MYRLCIPCTLGEPTTPIQMSSERTRRAPPANCRLGWGLQTWPRQPAEPIILWFGAHLFSASRSLFIFIVLSFVDSVCLFLFRVSSLSVSSLSLCLSPSPSRSPSLSFLLVFLVYLSTFYLICFFIFICIFIFSFSFP